MPLPGVVLAVVRQELGEPEDVREAIGARGSSLLIWGTKKDRVSRSPPKWVGNPVSEILT